MTVDDIAEALLTEKDVYITRGDINFTPNDLVNWADAHNGDLEIDGQLYDGTELTITAIYYWPKSTNVNELYADAIDFINDLAQGADEITLEKIGSPDPWRLWWD